jgi:hypothetical protein
VTVQDAWAAYVEAEGRMHAARMRLMKLDVAEVLPAALHSFDGRGAALRLLDGLPSSWTDRFVADLLRLAIVTHPEIGTTRRLLASADPDRIDESIGPFTERVIADPASTWEEYRRLAELLDELGRAGLLRRLVEAAQASSDPDIREVADDFAI